MRFQVVHVGPAGGKEDMSFYGTTCGTGWLGTCIVLISGWECVPSPVDARHSIERHAFSVGSSRSCTPPERRAFSAENICRSGGVQDRLEPAESAFSADETENDTENETENDMQFQLVLHVVL